MTSTLTDVAIVNITRSDGSDTGPGYWPSAISASEAAAAAQKTAEATAKHDGADTHSDAKAPRAKTQMIRLDQSDVRFLEFSMKLGALLKQEISPMPHGRWTRCS